MNDLFCVVSQNISESMLITLRELFSEIIELPPDYELAAPIQCHPDMIFAVVCGKMFLSRKYYAINRDIITRLSILGGWEIVLSNAPRSEKYPHDVAFNVAVTRDRNGMRCLLGHTKTVFPPLIEWSGENGIRFIPVKQGYAGCSCLVTDAGVLTFDRGLAVIMEKNQIPTYCLHGGGISLPGYNEGFLGGASGFYDNTIYIMGNVNSLPCADELKKFAYSSKYRITSLSNESVIDYGGLKIYQKAKGSNHV